MCPERNLEPSAPTSLRVLVIEDEPSFARLAEIVLAQHPTARFDVRVARTLAEGLRALDDTVFDAVVLDLNLPDSHGEATVAAIRAHRPRLAIVVLSASGDEATIHNAMRKGAQDYRGSCRTPRVARLRRSPRGVL